jgi:NAD(P)-dependent dehydrogenase (short-subunit alcohol dehydrogenase family)
VSAATDLLRPGLLEGASVLTAGSPDPAAALGIAIGEACTELGAGVHMCAPPDVADEAIVDQMVSAAITELGSLDLLVVDGAGLFAQGGLRDCLDATWNITRAVVNLAFLAAEPSSSNRPEPSSPTRRVIYLAPAPNAGRHSRAACAGLENLGRTLSTEWARHGITVVTIAPGEATDAGEVAALCAYLASPAGAYFSGCLLDLRGPER